jgi:NAD(P)H dehydrogenase (quinone)
MSTVVTGATGHLGRLAVEELLRSGVPAEEVIATGRRTDTLADLAAVGVSVRGANYDDGGSLLQAFTGADRLLLVSGSEVGQRVRQHTNVVRAAMSAGIGLIVYTSLAKADTSTLPIAEEHLATEALLADSGIPHVVLRNSWYTENYTSQLRDYLEQGILGAAGDGRISAATRADYAAAAVAALIEDGHAGTTYELGGEAFTMAELARVITEVTGRRVTYTDMTVAQYAQALVAAGLPEPVAAMLSDIDRAVAADDLLVDGADLEKLLGRPATTLRDAVTDAFTSIPA